MYIYISWNWFETFLKPILLHKTDAFQMAWMPQEVQRMMSVLRNLTVLTLRRWTFKEINHWQPEPLACYVENWVIRCSWRCPPSWISWSTPSWSPLQGRTMSARSYLSHRRDGGYTTSQRGCWRYGGRFCQLTTPMTSSLDNCFPFIGKIYLLGNDYCQDIYISLASFSVRKHGCNDQCSYHATDLNFRWNSSHRRIIQVLSKRFWCTSRLLF